MRIHLVHHADDADFAATLAREMASRSFERVDEARASDLALVLVSAAALRDGLGTAPKKALEAGVRVRTLLLGDDTIPLRFPVHLKHVDLVKDVATIVKLLVDQRKTLNAKIIDSKSDLFAYGLLLSLVHRR
jgi:hypothetical protein